MVCLGFPFSFSRRPGKHEKGIRFEGLFLGCLGIPLGMLWESFGILWGCFRGPLGVILGVLGASFGASRGYFGGLVGVLGWSWGLLVASCRFLVACKPISGIFREAF